MAALATLSACGGGGGGAHEGAGAVDQAFVADGGIPAPQLKITTVTMPYAGGLSVGIFAATGGQLVRALKETELHAANEVVTLSWDGKDDLGNAMPPGSYVWKAQATQAKAVYEGQIGDRGAPPGDTEQSAAVNSLAIDASGTVYEGSFWEEATTLTTTINHGHAIRAWDSGGAPITKSFFSNKNSAAIAIDNAYVYVASQNGHQIDRYRIDIPSDLNPTYWSDQVHSIQTNTTGGTGVYGLTVDSKRIWVSNYTQHALQVFDKNTGLALAPTAQGDLGAGCGAAGVAADDQGHAWVACMTSGSVTAFTYSGGTLTKGKQVTSLPGIAAPFTPFALAYGGPGPRLYVGDAQSGTITKVNPTTLVADGPPLFGAAQPGPVTFDHLRWPNSVGDNLAESIGGAIAVNASGTLVVSDPGNFRVMTFDPTGKRIPELDRYSEFEPAPQVDVNVDPNKVISWRMEYNVDYANPAHPWTVVNNWTPGPGSKRGPDFSNNSLHRRLANGREYIFYTGVHGAGVNQNGLVVYQIGANGTGLRKSAVIGNDGNDGAGPYTLSYPANGNAPKKVIPPAGEGVVKQGPSQNPGWWVDQAGNAWLSAADESTIEIPLDGFDTDGNPLYDWAHLKTVIPHDPTFWAFGSHNIRVDPVTKDIYRIGMSLQAPRDLSDTANVGGNVIDRRSIDGSIRNTMFITDPADPEAAATRTPTAGGATIGLAAVSTDSDGQYFYAAFSGGPRMWVKMYTSDGLLVTTTLGHEDLPEHAGWVDEAYGLTAFKHPASGTHYIYAEGNSNGTALRWRIDNLATTTRLNGTDGTAFVWTPPTAWQAVTVTATTPSVLESASAQGAGVFTLSRTNTEGPLTVSIAAAASSTAKAGVNYVALPSTVTFANDSATATVIVTPIDDNIRSTGSTVVLSVLPEPPPGGHYTPGLPSSSVMNILDTDTPVTVTATQAGTEQGPTSALFQIARDNTNGPLTVSYELSEPKPAFVGLVGVAGQPNENATIGLTYDGKFDGGWYSKYNGPGPYDGKSALTYVFPTVQTLSYTRISNMNGYNPQLGAKDVEVFISTDDSTAPGGGSFTSLGVTRLARGQSNAADYTWQTIDLGGVSAKQIKFALLSSYEESPASSAQGQVGLSEVELYARGASTGDYLPPTGATLVRGVTTGTITIPSGQLSATLSVMPVDDPNIELGGPELLELRILPTGQYRTPSPSKVSASIVDNDTGPSVTITATKARAYESGSDYGELTFTRTTTANDLAVHYVTATQKIAIVGMSASSEYKNGHDGTTAYDNDHSSQNYWLTNGNVDPGQGFGNDDNPAIRFDLGQPVTVGRFRVSNINGSNKDNLDANKMGAKLVEIWSSMDDNTYTQVQRSPVTFAIGARDIGASSPWQDFDLGGVYARYIQVRIKSNYFGKTFWNNCVPNTCPSHEAGQFPVQSFTGFSEIELFTGSTAATSDFSSTPLSGTVVIPAGSASTTLRLTPAQNRTVAAPKTLTLTLTSDNTTYTVGSPSAATITLVNGKPVTADYDGDGKTDRTIWRPSGTRWFVLNSSGAPRQDMSWGAADDIPLSGDYDGDGVTDRTVWRPSSGTWFILNSSGAPRVDVSWGVADDVPVVGDYDGDGKSDRAVWRPSNGTWYVLNSSGAARQDVQWGAPGDIPVAGDYDGDGKTDRAVWRPSNQTWYVLGSSDGKVQAVGWGEPRDVPLVGDYDGDGKADMAIWRPSIARWFILNSSGAPRVDVSWGSPGDTPVVGDFDGDGKADRAVWTAGQVWQVLNSSGAARTDVGWGVPGDVPLVTTLASTRLRFWDGAVGTQGNTFCNGTPCLALPLGFPLQLRGSGYVPGSDVILSIPKLGGSAQRLDAIADGSGTVLWHLLMDSTWPDGVTLTALQMTGNSIISATAVGQPLRL